jgi:YVTN family beta-propeller protein
MWYAVKNEGGRTMRTTIGYCLAAALLLGSFASPAMAYWGLVGCSTSDSASTFYYEWQTGEFVFSPAIPLGVYGNYPYDAVKRPGDTEVWIAGASGDGVVVISPAGVITHEIPTGEYPVSIAFNPRENIALVSCRDRDRLDIINTDTYTVTGSIPVPNAGLGPGNIIFDPQGDRFFLVEWYGDMLFEIAADGSGIVDQISTGNDLWQLTIDPNFGGYLFLTDRGTDQVRVIDPETLLQVQTIAVGDDPWGIDVDGDIVVVCCEDSHDIFIIDANDFSATQMLLDPDADPRDVNITTAWVTVGDKTLLGGAAYICGGQTSLGSPLYVLDLLSMNLMDPVDVPGTNSNVVAVEAQWPLPSAVEDLPATVSLNVKAAPNPFNPRTEISFVLKDEAPVKLAVFDLNGRMIRLIDAGTLGPGPRAIEWDGTDNRGQRLPSGCYMVTIQAGDLLESTKVALVQ